MNIILYDASNNRPGLDLPDVWYGASMVLQAAGKFKYAIGVRSWSKVVFEFDGIPTASIDAMQLWSHGMPGKPIIGNNGPSKNHLKQLSWIMKPNGLIWLRCCSVLFGQSGIDAACRIADLTGCKVAAYTRVIGVWQSGLYVVTPGVKPKNIPVLTGDWTKRKSGPRIKRSHRCTVMEMPKWA